jgi:hypothetical protein
MTTARHTGVSSLCQNEEEKEDLPSDEIEPVAVHDENHNLRSRSGSWRRRTGALAAGGWGL